MNKPMLMAVDGNSLAHRAYHAMYSSGLRDSQGRPSWAIKGFWSLLLGAIDRINPDAVIVGFDDSGNSARRAGFAEYKAQRGAKDDDLRTQLAAIPQVLAAAGIKVVIPTGLEADDVTAAAARDAGPAGWECTIVTSDRDAFAHISDTTSVLRVINGGIENSPTLNPDRFRTMVGIDPGQYLDYAALRGDTSDNLVGVRGIGEKTAAKLLSGMGTMTAVWADLENGGENIAKAAGKACVTRLRAEGAYEAWDRNRTIMGAVEVDLGIDLSMPGTAGHLPLIAEDVSAALMGYDLRTLVGAARNRLCAAAAMTPAPVAAPSAPTGTANQPRASAPAPSWSVDVPFNDEPPFDPVYDLVPAGASGGALHPAAYVSGF